MAADEHSASAFSLPPLDRSPKLFIGGKQVRPDSGYSRLVIAVGRHDPWGVGEGNRKDIRNAVEATAAATAWTAMSGHARARCSTTSLRIWPRGSRNSVAGCSQ